MADYVAKHIHDKNLSSRSRKIIYRSLAHALKDVKQNCPSSLAVTKQLLQVSDRQWAKQLHSKIQSDATNATELKCKTASSRHGTDFVLYDETLHEPFDQFEHSTHWAQHVGEVNAAISVIKCFIAKRAQQDCEPGKKPRSNPIVKDGLSGLKKVLLMDAYKMPSEYDRTALLFNQTKAQVMEIVSMIGQIDDSLMHQNLVAMLEDCRACAPGTMNSVLYTLERLHACATNEGEISASTIGLEFITALRASIDAQTKTFLLKTHEHEAYSDGYETHHFRTYQYLLAQKGVPGIPPMARPEDRYAQAFEDKAQEHINALHYAVLVRLDEHYRSAFDTVLKRVQDCLRSTLQAALPNNAPELITPIDISSEFFGEHVFPALTKFEEKFQGIFRALDLYGEHTARDKEDLYYLKTHSAALRPVLSVALGKLPELSFPTPYSAIFSNNGSKQLKICRVTWESWVETSTPNGAVSLDLDVAAHLHSITPEALASSLLLHSPQKENALVFDKSSKYLIETDIENVTKHLAQNCLLKARLAAQRYAGEVYSVVPSGWAALAKNTPGTPQGDYIEPEDHVTRL